MTRFDPERAEIRFGCGLSPKIPPHESVEAMLSSLRGPDHSAQGFPISGFEDIRPSILEIQAALNTLRQAKTTGDQAAARDQYRKLIRALQGEAIGWFRQALLRRVFGADGFRERLTFFWADHFTVKTAGGKTREGYMPYIEDVIRPNVSGNFGDMLKAAVTHPVMLEYLDQSRSVGPNSTFAQKGKRSTGINENLARELLELHALGVDGPYTQADVRSLAELLTGLNNHIRAGVRFRPDFAEPGVHTILGQSFGGETPSLDHIMEAMDSLARHPATARHIARKLAVHFVSDTPDADLVKAMSAQFLETEGDLPSVYEVMLNHPSSWHAGLGNVKQPIDFIGSALRALDLVPRHLPQDPRELRKLALGPLELMGQPWGDPLGPDGWPEADTDWITPQRMAARIHWAMRAPFLLRRVLPDPRDLAQSALGSTASESLLFAARAAETRPEGIGLILASPQFQRT